MFPSRRVERQQTSSVFSYKWKRKKMRKTEVEKRRKQQQDTETPSGGPSLRFASCKSGSWRSWRRRRSFAEFSSPSFPHAIDRRNVLDCPPAESPGAQWVDRHCKNLLPDMYMCLYSNVRCVSEIYMRVSELTRRNWISN